MSRVTRLAKKAKKYKKKADIAADAGRVTERFPGGYEKSKPYWVEAGKQHIKQKSKEAKIKKITGKKLTKKLVKKAKSTAVRASLPLAPTPKAFKP